MSSIIQRVDGAIEGFSTLPWESPSLFGCIVEPWLRQTSATDGLLAALLARVLENPKLFSAGELNPTLTKIVLAHSRDWNIQLRLHFFVVGADARPHDHRWPFSSVILKGGYRHSIYAPLDGAPDGLIALSSRHEGAGDAYSLSEHAIHTTEVAEATVSLMLRGPSRKQLWSRMGSNEIERLGSGRTISQQQRPLDFNALEKGRLLLVEAGLI